MSTVIGVGIVASVCAYLLEGMGFRGTKIFLVFSSVLILSAVLELVSDKLLSAFIFFSKTPSDVGKSILKILGVGYVGGISADIARDLGAAGVSDGLNLFMRVEILAMIAPYFIEILKLCEGLLK